MKKYGATGATGATPSETLSTAPLSRRTMKQVLTSNVSYPLSPSCRQHPWQALRPALPWRSWLPENTRDIKEREVRSNLRLDNYHRIVLIPRKQQQQ